VPQSRVGAVFFGLTFWFASGLVYDDRVRKSLLVSSIGMVILFGSIALAPLQYSVYPPYVDEGAYVFITGRLQSELDAAVKQIGKNVNGVQGDVSNLADLDRLYATMKEQKGGIILFANAGFGEQAPLGIITEAHFDKTFSINVKGLLFTVQKALAIHRYLRTIYD
jgi:hypothetical protein